MAGGRLITATWKIWMSGEMYYTRQGVVPMIEDNSLSCIICRGNVGFLAEGSGFMSMRLFEPYFMTGNGEVEDEQVAG